MPKKKRTKPLIIIKTKTKLAPEEELREMIRSLQFQVDEHFEPAWGLGATIRFSNDPAPRDAYQITVRRKGSADDHGYLGYHFSSSGFPVASIFAEEDMKGDKTISDTLSHEILEMLVDPACNLYAHRPSSQGRPGRGYFYEVCDAVQCEKYKIGDYLVTDFVYPEWFEHVWPKGSRKFDHLGLLDEPFQILKGCYADIYEGRKRGKGRFRTIWGSEEKHNRGRHRLRMRMQSEGHQ